MSFKEVVSSLTQYTEVTLESVGEALTKLALLAESRGFAPWKQQAKEKTNGGAARAYSMFPIRDTTAFSFLKRQQSILWVADEMQFQIDANNFRNLPKRYQQIYKDFLGFFAPGDGLITEQAVRFLSEAKSYEESAFLCSQLYIEQVHAETYGLAIATVIPEKEHDEIFTAIERLDCVKAKGDFIKRYMNSDSSLSTRYLAGAFTEGVFFSALFALIFFFRRKNVFKTFCTANAFIMRDESLHRDFNCMMASRYKDFDTETAHAIAREVYDIEVSHLEYILREPVDSDEADEASGLTVENVKCFIRNLVDQVLVMAGVTPLFNESRSATEALPWMADIGLQGKQNFYEAIVIDYSAVSVNKSLESTDDRNDVNEFTDSCEF